MTDDQLAHERLAVARAQADWAAAIVGLSAIEQLAIARPFKSARTPGIDAISG